MVLLSAFFSSADFFVGPVFFVILMMVFTAVISKYKDDVQRKLFLNAFYYKMFMTLLYTSIMAFYYKGGDTEMYFECTVDLHKAVMDDSNNFIEIYRTHIITAKSPLMTYFIFNDSPYPNFEAMHSPANFFVPKIGLPFMLVFGRSYLVLAMAFGFFSLAGGMRLYKVFYHYFPQYYREIALACLFLPSVCFWSSGFLKDTICFGSMGFLVYGMFNIFIRKRSYLSSIIWVIIASFFLFYIKVYILLALAPAIVLWLFGEFNKVVENKTLRRIMALITFTAGGLVAFLLINYVSSDDSVNQFKLDAIIETSKYNRELYAGFSDKYEGSYYTINTSSPVLLVVNGLVAALFRPFLWEVNSPTALMSALESFFFLYCTLFLMYKKGVINFFRRAFATPIFMMCMVFSVVFAAAIGSSATNFGSLSRYKIPCLPFYLCMVLIMIREAGLQHPKWFRKLLGYRVPLPSELKAKKRELKEPVKEPLTT